MYKYRIKYKLGYKGITTVEADSVNGFQPTSDTYTFKVENEIVVAIPKDVVVSIDRVNTESDT